MKAITITGYDEENSRYNYDVIENPTDEQCQTACMVMELSGFLVDVHKNRYQSKERLEMLVKDLYNDEVEIVERYITDKELI